jgi:thiol-disulfide isomerase/thioredoxin
VAVLGVAALAAACAVAAVVVADRRSATAPPPLVEAPADAEGAPADRPPSRDPIAAARDDEPAPPAPDDASEPEPVTARAGEPASCAVYSLADLPDAPPRASVSTTWYEGARGFRSAEAEQAASGAPLLALFSVDWCPHCRRFIAEVIPSPEMRDLGERIVKVKVDAEGSEDDQALARRFSVKSFPTLLLFPAPGNPPVHIRNWTPAREFVESCERAMPNRARARLTKGVALARARPEDAAGELKAATADPALAPLALDHLGTLALGAGCFERAVAIYTRVLELDPGYQHGRAHHLRGFAHLRSGATSLALEDAERACRLGYEQACPIAERMGRAAAAAR